MTLQMSFDEMETSRDILRPRDSARGGVGVGLMNQGNWKRV